MQGDTQRPAVEKEYEGPSPRHQRIWTESISGLIILLAGVFVIVMLAIIFI